MVKIFDWTADFNCVSEERVQRGTCVERDIRKFFFFLTTSSLILKQEIMVSHGLVIFLTGN